MKRERDRERERERRRGDKNRKVEREETRNEGRRERKRLEARVRVTSRRLVYEVVKLKGFDVACLSDVATRCYAFRFDRCVRLTRLLRT